MPETESVNTQRWDENAAILISSPLSRLQRRTLLRRCRFSELVSKDKRIMDLGCGHGPFLSYFWSEGYRSLGAIEPDPKLTKSIPSHIKADIKHCKAEKIDFPDASFDAVWVYGVLHHLKGLDAYRACCDEIKRVLKPGGVAFILEPGRYRLFLAMEAVAKVLGLVSKTFRAFSETMIEEEKEQHFFLQNHGEVRDRLKASGMQVLVDDYFIYTWLFTVRKPG